MTSFVRSFVYVVNSLPSIEEINITIRSMPRRYYCMPMIVGIGICTFMQHEGLSWSSRESMPCPLHVTPMWPVTTDTNCTVPPHLMFHMGGRHLGHLSSNLQKHQNLAKPMTHHN